MLQRSSGVRGALLLAHRQPARHPSFADPLDGAGERRDVGSFAAVILVSFDIDGTLEVGDPPGPILLAAVRQARQLGYVIGSASDRTRSDQESLWKTCGISVDFVGGKHHLPEVRERFDCTRYVHIGDSLVDELYANQAGFEFRFVDGVPADGKLDWLH